MSRLYEALRRAERERRQLGAMAPEPAAASLKAEESANADPATAQKRRLVNFEIPLESRLVALKSLQVTSGVIGEGKTLITGNLGLTFAKCSRSKVLLIEGDLHCPKLAAVFGLSPLPGVTDWWSGAKRDIQHSLYQLQDLPLWFLLAGGTHEQPSEILQSPRFAEAFAQFSRQFDWIVVDSAPMISAVAVNLWSRLVDGTLLVVREGVAPVKALKKGLASLDNPKLVGVVFNETSELDRAST